MATGSLHTHHGIGWLAYGGVVPDARGRGFQRAMLVERARVAVERGCDVVASYAESGHVSATNMEAIGMHEVAVRGGYSSRDLT